MIAAEGGSGGYAVEQLALVTDCDFLSGCVPDALLQRLKGHGLVTTVVRVQC